MTDDLAIADESYLHKATLRIVAQILIEEIGADGPCNAKEAAERAVQKIRWLQERSDLFWKLMGEGPTAEHSEDDMVVLLKDLRNAMLCGAEGEVHCYSKDVTYLRDLMEKK